MSFYNNATKYCLIVCNKYSIPSDISKLIYDLILNKSIQFIIDKWYSYVFIHNTNLSKLINNLVVKVDHSTMTYPNFYYDVTDPKVYYTFKICLKYIKYNLASEYWWLEKINYLCNGIYILYPHCYNYIQIQDIILKFRYTIFP